MGQTTYIQIATYHSTGHGSDYYGSCEICKKSVSETFVGQTHTVYTKRHDGQTIRYLSRSSPGLFGHRACVEQPGAIDKAKLPTIGSLRIVPADIFSAIL